MACNVGDIVELKTESGEFSKFLEVINSGDLAKPIAKKPEPITILNNEVITLSPEQLAEAFWNLDSSEQARFYNHLDTVADFNFPFQLQSITDDDGLTLAGRRVMQHIGEYSHWGLVPTIRNGVVK